ncbi:MAG: hypothetical protein DRJ38_09565 [Thermoprotei archaeon]|nr:MAG: hypothetical protein DRJ38_09565 [Thermoprotei archaeon]
MNYSMVIVLAILIDTGVFYALYNKRDIHHLDSICILAHVLEGRYGRAYTTDLVISETATLIRYRIGLKAMMAFLDFLENSGIAIIFLDKELYDGVIEVFKKYADRKLSFADAFTIYAVDKLDIGRLATYDERSFSGIVEEIVGKDYVEMLGKEELERILTKIGLK